MYTIRYCPYCINAKALLDRKGVPYIDHDITHLPDAELNRMMRALTGRKTVPEIWVDGQHIGGYDELKALDDVGKLDAMLGLVPSAPRESHRSGGSPAGER
jgi:glutaredoxin 3